MASRRSQDPIHPVVDSFTEVLRALAQSAAELGDEDGDEIVRQCQQLVDQISSASPEKRAAVDWNEVRDLAVKLIQREHEFAVSRFADFRQMIWVVIQGLREAFQDEQSSENEVVQHLTRLNQAVDSDSIDELRTEVVAAVVLINRAIEERKKRQRDQLEELGLQLNRMRYELLKAQKELALDPMTRLYNRASFDELLEKTIELSLFSGQPSCLMMVDIDHFKGINDRYGHVSGDNAVLRVAEMLKKTFPRKTDFVARYGGDEFAVILQDTEPHDGEMLGKRLLSDAKSQIIDGEDGASFGISLSVGVAALQASDTATAWVSRADQALYQAKGAGRGCVRMVDSSS